MSGDLEIIRIDTGERRIIQMDGSEIRDTVPPPKIDFCDKCETFKSAMGGKYDYADGVPVLWYCEACK